jgi:hypothetical protein
MRWRPGRSLRADGHCAHGGEGRDGEAALQTGAMKNFPLLFRHDGFSRNLPYDGLSGRPNQVARATVRALSDNRDPTAIAPLGSCRAGSAFLATLPTTHSLVKAWLSALGS